MRIFSLTMLLSIMTLSAAFVAAQKPAETPAKPSTANAGVKRDQTGFIIFPDIAGMQKDKPYVYPVAGGGYSVNYNSQHSRVTVYEYDSQQKNIPNELGRLIRGEMETAKQGIRSAVEAGVYNDLKTVKTDETVTLGGPSGKVKALQASFTLRRGDVSMRSYIFLFPYDGKFIKIRVTRSLEATKEDDEAYARLLGLLDELFANPPETRMVGMLVQAAPSETP